MGEDICFLIHFWMESIASPIIGIKKNKYLTEFMKVIYMFIVYVLWWNYHKFFFCI